MARRLKINQYFRHHFSLSQTDIANYLCVSLSLVAMWEKNKRSLPKEAHKKIAALEIALEKNKGNQKISGSVRQLQKKFDEHNNKVAKKMQIKTSTHRPKANMLERRLDETIKKQQDQISWLNFLDQKLATSAENKTTKADRDWFVIQQLEVSKRLEKTNKEITKLSYDIDLLRAVADVHERHVQRLRK
jgi:predicted transcriptional regulator